MISGLAKTEKVFLIVLVTLALILSYISTYAALKKQNYIPPSTQPGQTKTLHYKFNSKSSPQDWNKIGNDIRDSFPYFTSFLIVVPEKWVVQTASCLSFMFENLSKTIAVASTNSSYIMDRCKYSYIPEVVVIHEDGSMFRGCQYPKTNIYLTEYNCLSSPDSETTLQYIDIDKNIQHIPNLTTPNLQFINHEGNIDAVIIENYHPSIDIQQLPKIEKVIVVFISQNEKNVAPHILQNGYISCGNITIESAYTKLLYLFGNVPDHTLIPQLMIINMRGEFNSLK